jgi:hypothetical protein
VVNKGIFTKTGFRETWDLEKGRDVESANFFKSLRFPQEKTETINSLTSLIPLPGLLAISNQKPWSKEIH